MSSVADTEGAGSPLSDEAAGSAATLASVGIRSRKLRTATINKPKAGDITQLLANLGPRADPVPGRIDSGTDSQSISFRPGAAIADLTTQRTGRSGDPLAVEPVAPPVTAEPPASTGEAAPARGVAPAEAAAPAPAPASAPAPTPVAAPPRPSPPKPVPIPVRAVPPSAARPVVPPAATGGQAPILPGGLQGPRPARRARDVVRQDADIQSYWNRLRKGRRFPAWVEFDTHQIAQSWPNSFLLACDPDPQRPRGNPTIARATRIAAQAGPTGQPEEIRFTQPMIEWILSVGRDVAKFTQPIRDTEAFATAGGLTTLTVIALPLSGDGQRIDQILCHVRRA